MRDLIGLATSLGRKCFLYISEDSLVRKLLEEKKVYIVRRGFSHYKLVDMFTESLNYFEQRLSSSVFRFLSRHPVYKLISNSYSFYNKL